MNRVRIHFDFKQNQIVFLPLICWMMEYSSGRMTGLKSPLRAKNEKPEISSPVSLLILSLSSS